MALTSTLFSGNQRLLECSVDHSKNIKLKTPREKGEHVAKIQNALFDLMNNVRIPDDELGKMEYGPVTANYVWQYKKDRDVVNHSYQSEADKIVGIMTIDRMDKELNEKHPKGGPVQPPKIVPLTPELPSTPIFTHLKWSASGYFGLMLTVSAIPKKDNGKSAKVDVGGQFGIGIVKFRNDETGTVKHYMIPMFGGGATIDVTKVVEWVKQLRLSKLAPEIQSLINGVVGELDLIARRGALEFLKSLALKLIGGGSIQDWTDWSQCDVYLPLSHKKIDGATLGNVSASIGLYQAQKVWVYGYTSYRDARGKGFKRKDFLSFSSTGGAIQIPSLGFSLVGGPLLML